MRCIIQRVSHASVTINDQITGKIAHGLLLFLGIEALDTIEDIAWLSKKIVGLRIFDDAQGVMNHSLKEIKGELLLVSQFTLHASTKKGNRPSYIKAARPELAIPLYQKMILQLQNDLGKEIATGTFGADMQIALLNDGPVSIWIDSKNKE